MEREEDSSDIFRGDQRKRAAKAVGNVRSKGDDGRERQRGRSRGWTTG